MDKQEALEAIETWTRRGNLRQVKTEVEAHLGEGETVTMDGNTLTFTRIRKEGGFLGIRAKTIKDTLLVITVKDGTVQILPEPQDQAFVKQLANALKKRR